MAATRPAPALLIVDMIGQFDYPGADRMAPSAVRAAGVARAVRDRFHRRGWPVVYANDNFAHWQSDFRELVAMAAGTPGAAGRIAEVLEPRPEDHFVLKPKHSAFQATALPVLLAKLGVDRLVLAGMALESCILATAIDANAREYRVAVARDAVGGRAALRAATFKVLEGAKIATVLQSAQVAAWCRRAR